MIKRVIEISQARTHLSIQYGYPPDMELLATEDVLKQAELLADEWAYV